MNVNPDPGCYFKGALEAKPVWGLSVNPVLTHPRMATWFVEGLGCLQSCLLGAKDPDFSLLTEARFYLFP